MHQYIVTPWKSRADLLHVRALLFGPTTTRATQRDAIAIIHAWSLRRAHLPHAVESTALLVDALLAASNGPPSTAHPSSNENYHSNTVKDSRGSEPAVSSLQPQPWKSPYTAQLALSSAFTFFVTGYCDMAQRSFRKQRMSDVARTIGMPERFIAFRHEVTHEGRASVRRLRKMCAEGVEWLREKYWDGLEEEPRMEWGSVDAMAVEEAQGEVEGCLKRYKKVRVGILEAGKEDVKRTMEAMRAVNGGVGEVRGRVGHKVVVEGLVAALCRLGMMFPRTMGAAKLVPSKDQGDAKIEAAFAVWEPLLRVFVQALDGFFERLVERLVGLVCDESGAPNDGRSKAAVRWLLRLFLNETWKIPGLVEDAEDVREGVVQTCEEHRGLSDHAEEVCQKLRADDLIELGGEREHTSDAATAQDDGNQLSDNDGG